MIRFTLVGIDVYLALLVLALGLVGSVHSYRLIAALESAPPNTALLISEGLSALALLDGSTCVGRAEITLSHDVDFNLSLAGEIALRLKDQIATATFESNAIFNPIGQLRESETKIDSGGIGIDLVTKNVKPIDVMLTLRWPQSSRNMNFSIPSPLQLVKQGAGGYLLELPDSSLPPSITGGLVSGNGDRMIEIRKSKSLDDLCPKESIKPLDVASKIPLTSVFSIPDLDRLGSNQ